jgi:nucleotide-binding universal stress UspA family protein
MDNFPIIVGYDGSDGARAALLWALDEAALRAAPLRLVYVIEDPVTSAPMFSVPFEYSVEAHRAQARSLLADAVAAAADTHPGVDVRTDMIDGSAAATLGKLSDAAGLVVLGSRGMRGIVGLLVGSTGVAVADHTHCPLVVVRVGTHTRSRKPVIVGVDDSAQARMATAFAFEEATLRGVDLVAARAWTPPPRPWHSDLRSQAEDAAEVVTAERHALHAAIQGLADEHRSVTVSTRLIVGDARHTLSDASAEAQLVVVGSRGRDGFAGLVLGSVSHFLLQHGHCPVAVIPTR